MAENTSYDELWESFLQVCGYDYSELPQTDERRYILIKNTVRLYNQKAKKYEGRIKGNIKGDDDMEELNVALNDTEILIFSYLMSHLFATNKYTEFTSVWGVFAKETGLKDYKAQCSAREYTIEKFEKEANRLIEDEIDSFSL